MASIDIVSQTHLDEDKDYPPFFEQSLQEVLADVKDDQHAQFAFLMDQIYESNETELIDVLSPEDLHGYLSFMREELLAFAASGDNRVICTTPGDGDDWSLPYSIVNVVCPDYPFVTDSIIDWIGGEGYRIEHTVYRCVDGEFFDQPDDEKRKPFFVSLMIEPLNEQQLTTLRADVEELLEDLVVSVDDFDSMLDRVSDLRNRLNEVPEDTGDSPYDPETLNDFLEYLVKDNFVFLGYGHTTTTNGEVDLSDELGLLRRSERYPIHELPGLGEAQGKPVDPDRSFALAKTNLLSRVYRRDRLYALTIPDLDEDGNVTGYDVFLGLFANRVLTEPATQLPVLKQRFDRIVEREDLAEHTRDYRDVYSIFNSMPKHLLFVSPLEDLIEDIRTVRDVRGERTFKLRTRPMPDQRGLTMMIIMEKEKFSGDIRKRIQAKIREEFDADHVDYRLSLGEGSMARLHFDIETDRLSPKSGSFDELEAIFFELTRTWTDRLKDLIRENTSERNQRERYERYLDRFPENYRALVNPDVALRDIENLESLNNDQTSPPVVDMVNTSSDMTHLMIYNDEKYSLNETMPILSNHGFTVVQQATFQIDLNGSSYHLHLFDIQNDEGNALDLTDRKAKYLRSIREILVGSYRDDSLNELIMRENLTTETLDLFRLYKNYFHQLSPAIKLETINRTLLEHAGIAETLQRLFHVKFDPTREDENRDQTRNQLQSELTNALRDIDGRTPYEILHSLLNLIEATVRTNFFQQPGDTPSPEVSSNYISVKIECESVERMPEPKPLYEIFVYSSLMEATHLRSGKIARGGIRWSDRRDDYRTEVLGLMKTQKVKNALIVPEGAKGGFVLKTEYLDDDKPLDEHAREQYAVFMHATLDLTDNYVDGELVTPPNLITYDEEDPYHVVAADKGTATFSDTANAIAEKYDFWLGDAFASGGSVGYDHKELGITAKGGWECVKRHFRELGRDIQTEPFTVAGIGDMSGDVFGNGMILSDQIKLVAAFDHRNVFLDPDPDPATSFEERKRLFEMEDSSWEDYDESLISEGGGVYDRGANLLQLEDAALEMLGLDRDEITPDELIKAILCADVDLLWNGGIGTYIKSSDETHSEVGDPQNDAFRADADEVQASVIGEGGNLGITQKGRVELDRNGVKLNTDFIDNSGGVDLSDHEVNLKILLKESIKQGTIEGDEREELLMDQVDPIVEDVVHDNYEQSGIISLESAFSGERLEDYRHLMQHLEETINLNRSVEHLPDEKELQDRTRANESMTRPEIAVLLSYTKMDLYNRSRREAWPEPTVIEPFVRRYFPDEIVEHHGDALANHRLRKEIAMTTLVNYTVDGAGCIFFHRLEEELGSTLIRLMKSYLAADRFAGGESLRRRIFELDNEIPAATQYDAWQFMIDNFAHAVSWLIDTINVSVVSEGFQEEMTSALDEHFGTILRTLQDRQAGFLNQNIERWRSQGLGDQLSEDLGRLPYLVPALEVILLDQDVEGIEIEELSELYFKFGKTLHIDWVIRRIFEQDASSRWDQFAFRTLGIELHELQRQLLQRLVERNQSLEDFKEQNEDTLRRLDDVQRSLAHEETDEYSAYQYMAQRMRSLL